MPTSELLQKQWVFAADLSKLLDYAGLMGFKVSLGESYRSDEQAEINAIGQHGREMVAQLIEAQFPLLAKKIRNNTGNGIRNSVHCLRLAQDLQLFDVAGNKLDNKEPYELLADHWESLGPDHRAGVRWGDSYHYSIEFQGVK